MERRKSRKSHITQTIEQEYIGFQNPYKGAGVTVVEYILTPTRAFDVAEAHLIN